MRIVVLVSFIVVLALSASVSAQKGNVIQPIQPKPVTIQPNQEIVIEDDAVGSFLVINPTSGDYKFIRCMDGFALSGTGVLKINGCQISFEDLTPGRRVLASIDECAQQAKAIVETFALVGAGASSDVAFKESLSDTDMRDNTTSCLPEK